MRRIVLTLARTPLGMIGGLLATVSGVLILALAVLGGLGFRGGPYLGIFAFLVLPGFFVLGLLLIPAGAWWERRRTARAAETGEAPGVLPIVDLNDLHTRQVVLVVAALTAVNLAVVALATYKGVQVMDSPSFCGSCHSVMDPEYTTYQRSPHARVSCVECHIGPGAPWFVKSKLSGAWQLVSVNFNLYPKPIPVPVHDLRPARDTCEHCHWPAKFVGSRLRVLTSHGDDSANAASKTVLLLHVGGGETPRAAGIHWHVASGVEVRYLADSKRQKIGTVELTLADGTRRTFTTKDGPSAPGPDATWRTMDCIDCHNRPSHIYRLPEREVDDAINAGRIDATLPFVRREGVRLLKVDYPSHAAAREGIRKGLAEFYAKSQPEVLPVRKEAVDAAAVALGDIFTANVWPSMNIKWGTYPSFLGHDAAPGCFRCHDETHATADGKAISQDCGLCHSLLAVAEKSPAILKQLNP
jgi:hypothetical protein